jgi:hypothetical protein
MLQVVPGCKKIIDAEKTGNRMQKLVGEGKQAKTDVVVPTDPKSTLKKRTRHIQALITHIPPDIVACSASNRLNNTGVLQQQHILTQAKMDGFAQNAGRFPRGPILCCFFMSDYWQYPTFT